MPEVTSGRARTKDPNEGPSPGVQGELRELLRTKRRIFRLPGKPMEASYPGQYLGPGHLGRFPDTEHYSGPGLIGRIIGLNVPGPSFCS